MRIALAVAFDIDNTLRNTRPNAAIEDIEWNGESDYWKNLCDLLREICIKTGVEIYFGIVTSKTGIDDLVWESVACLEKYLVMSSNTQSPSRNLVGETGSWIVCYDGKSYKITTKNKMYQVDVPTCVHVTNGKDKSISLEKIKNLYRINTSADVILVDDNIDVCNEVMEKGFSFVCAESINAGENTAEQRDNETVRVIIAVVEKVKERIIAAKFECLLEEIEIGTPTQLIRDFCNSKMPNGDTLLSYVAQYDIKVLKKLVDANIFSYSEIVEALPGCANALSMASKGLSLFEQKHERLEDCVPLRRRFATY